MTAIVQHIDERELKIWVENENFPFPILFDQDSKVTKAFGVNKTPLMIVSDSIGNIISVVEINNRYNKKKSSLKC